MKPNIRNLILERMFILIDNARSNVRTNPELAQRQAGLAKRLSTKYRIRMPYELKIHFCKKCKKFILPGFTARIRIGGGNEKSIRITCLFCNHIYRKLIKNNFQYVNDL